MHAVEHVSLICCICMRRITNSGGDGGGSGGGGGGGDFQWFYGFVYYMHIYVMDKLCTFIKICRY